MDIRHSRASEAEVIIDPSERARQEARNGILQFKAVERLVESSLEGGRNFRLRPSHLLHLHRVALIGVSPYAGNWRPSNIEIGGSIHKPPSASDIPEQIEELCDYVNERWDSKSPLHLASYVMWKLNWVHPFTDGNGRTSRAVSYLVLCIRLGYLLPGKLTIPDQISADKQSYYRALVLLCYKCGRRQQGHLGRERARWVAIWRRRVAMECGLCRSVLTGSASWRGASWQSR